MRRRSFLVFAILVVLVILVAAVPVAQGGEKKLDAYNTVVVKPFENNVKGAIGLPTATQDAVIQALKESMLFNEVVTLEDSKTKQTLTKEEVKTPSPDTTNGAQALPKPEDQKNTETKAVELPKPVKTLHLESKLIDFEPGSAAKRLMVGFGTGRAHAGFEFTLKDAATGEVVWSKTIKQTASFWFNGTTSSAAERSELPEGVAKKLVEELKKLKGK